MCAPWTWMKLTVEKRKKGQSHQDEMGMFMKGRDRPECHYHLPYGKDQERERKSKEDHQRKSLIPFGKEDEEGDKTKQKKTGSIHIPPTFLSLTTDPHTRTRGGYKRSVMIMLPALPHPTGKTHCTHGPRGRSPCYHHGQHIVPHLKLREK